MRPVRREHFLDGEKSWDGTQDKSIGLIRHTLCVPTLHDTLHHELVGTLALDAMY